MLDATTVHSVSTSLKIVIVIKLTPLSVFISHEMSNTSGAAVTLGVNSVLVAVLTEFLLVLSCI